MLHNSVLVIGAVVLVVPCLFRLEKMVYAHVELVGICGGVYLPDVANIELCAIANEDTSST